MTDIELGKEAFRYFHNRSARYSGYTYSFQELLACYGKKADIYADGIGLAIRSNEMPMTDVKKSMEGLADVAQGRIPKDHQEYIKYLGNQAAKINYLDLTATVAKEVATQTVNGAAALGDSVLTSLAWLNNLLPFVVVAVVLFIVYGRASKIAGKDLNFKKVADAVKKKIKKAKA